MSTLPRRKLLAKMIDQVAKASTAVQQELQPSQLRPPGALPEADFLAACTRCERCTQACPEQAVFRFTESAGLLAGTPVMIPDDRACSMCDGFPCAAACEDGALQVPESAGWNLGSVRIDEGRCIAFAGPECGACTGLCPADAAALTLDRWRPKVDPERCIGCGLCIAACPVAPTAILFEPRE